MLLSLEGTSIKYLFLLISSKYPYTLLKIKYKGFTLLVFTYLESFFVTYPISLYDFSSILTLFGSKLFILIISSKQ